MFPSPGNAGFNQYDAGPHAGTPTDPNAHTVSDSLERRVWTVLRSRWTGIVVVCLVVAIGAFMSLTWPAVSISCHR